MQHHKFEPQAGIRERALIQIAATTEKSTKVLLDPQINVEHDRCHHVKVSLCYCAASPTKYLHEQKQTRVLHDKSGRMKQQDSFSEEVRKSLTSIFIMN